MRHTRTNPGITYEQQPGKLPGLSINQHSRKHSGLTVACMIALMASGCDRSESIIKIPPDPIPVPSGAESVPDSGASAAMMGLALLAVVVFRRIRK
jgi:hypothetical protein